MLGFWRVVARLLNELELKGKRMDFIERIFGGAPDGGTGTLEISILLVPVFTVVLLAFFWCRRAWRSW
jgi:hypothetical protein